MNKEEEPVVKTFIPGDKWLYLKLYTGYKTADNLLINVLPYITNKLNSAKILYKWFFIRYSDPHFHLRLRFCFDSNENIPFALININQAVNDYVEQGLIWKVQYDTYQRELERYGYTTMDDAEDIFYADSIAIINILKEIDDEFSEEKRWLIALKLIDSFLDNFDYSVIQKYEILSKMAESFIDEFEFSKKEYRMQLDQKYRLHKKKIEEIIFDSASNINWYSPIKKTLAEKSKYVVPIASKLIKKEKQNTLDIPLNTLLTSYIHMTINRLFRSKQRIYELVLYDMLRKFYFSQMTRT
jgi:thiopeptide-type bacteriocin biosynthesis protein